MSRIRAPSLPTEEQIRKAHTTVAALCPGVRIKQVGPDGVTFEYPDAPGSAANGYIGKPFAPERT